MGKRTPFGIELEREIRRKGWAIKDFAEIVGVSRTSAQAWLSGKTRPNFKHLVAIEKAGCMKRERAFKLIFGKESLA